MRSHSALRSFTLWLICILRSCSCFLSSYPCTLHASSRLSTSQIDHKRAGVHTRDASHLAQLLLEACAV